MRTKEAHMANELRVVVATDGSHAALLAARRAHQLLEGDVSAVVVSVAGVAPLVLVASGPAGAGLGDRTGAETQQVRSAMEDAAREAIDDTVAQLPDWAIETCVAMGQAGPVICDLAKEVDADVIVVGARGRGVLRRMFLGSVSSHVVRNATCPVLVVNENDRI
jgi:nucleotide-binding universal stress UspA family protein